MAKRTDDTIPADGMAAAIRDRLEAERREARRVYDKFVRRGADDQRATAAEADELVAALRVLDQDDADFNNDVQLLKQLRQFTAAAHSSPELEAADTAEMAASVQREQKFKADALAEIAVRQAIQARQSERAQAVVRVIQMKQRHPHLARLVEA